MWIVLVNRDLEGLIEIGFVLQFLMNQPLYVDFLSKDWNLASCVSPYYHSNWQVFSTLSFSGSSLFSRMNRVFDVVIIDEAAQAVSALFLLSLTLQWSFTPLLGVFMIYLVTRNIVCLYFPKKFLYGTQFDFNFLFYTIWSFPWFLPCLLIMTFEKYNDSGQEAHDV